MKLQFKTGILALALLLSCLSFVTPALAAGTLTVSAVSGKVGETVDVEISLSADDVCSGNFNIIYDETVMDVVETTMAEGRNGYCNKKADGLIRVSFAQTTPVKSGLLCVLTVKITEDTSVDGSPIELAQILLYNENSIPVETNVITGTVSRSCARLSISSEETAEYQAVRAEIRLSGSLHPAGGNFTVSYDPDKVEPGAVLALGGLSSGMFSYNVLVPGKVRVSFSGTREVPAGKLCALMFQTKAQAGESTDLTITDVQFYDVDSKSIDTVVTNGRVSIVLPSENDPKLWVVGGGIDEIGSATVGLLLQGRGYVYGGNATLIYDADMTPTVKASDGCQIRQGKGEILVSWAGSTPCSDEESLVTVTFANAKESTVSIENVTLYDADSKALPVADIRPGELSAIRQATAYVDEDEIHVSASGKQTTVQISLDVADMCYFTAEQRSSLAPVLALYRDGQLVGTAVPDDLQLISGVGEWELTAKANGAVSDLKVFLMDTGENCMPLCDAWGSALN